MRVILYTVLIFLFVGCSTKIPPVTEYKIVTNTRAKSVGFDGCKDKTLKIAQAFSSTSLMSMRMDYTVLDNKIYSYTQSQWSDTPNRAVTLEILQYIRGVNFFKFTQNPKTRSKSDLILETYIEDFMQYYSKDLSDSKAVVQISFALIDTKTNDIISSKTIKSSVKTETNDAQGGAKALNVALENVLNESVKWLGEICQ